MTKKPPARPRKKKASSPLRVFEKKTPTGLVLSTKEDERVAYCTPEGWLLLDDEGRAVVKTREEAEAFVAGLLGLTTNALAPARGTTAKTATYIVVTEADLQTKAGRLAKEKARAQARALFAEGEGRGEGKGKEQEA